MKTITSRLIAMIILILVLGALGLATQHYGSMDWIVDNETRLRDFVSHQPLQAWMIGLVIYTAFSLVPGTSGKSVIFGWLFGFWQAVLMVDVGLTIAAIASFVASRFIVRDIVNERLGGLVAKLDSGLERDGAFYLLMMRLAHVPYSLVNYGAGATSVPLRKFVWTTSAGILPGTMIFVFVGTRIPTLADLAEKGVWQLLDPLLFAVLAALVIFPALIHWAINRFKKRSGLKSDLELSDFESLPALNSKTRQTNGTS